MILLLLLLAVPAAEIFIFIEVGGQIGAWSTVGLIFATAIVGGTILRFQGIRILMKAREQLAHNQPPVAEIVEGAGLVLAAVFLLTPGFLTDALGALLLVPTLRRAILRAAIIRLRARAAARQTSPQGAMRHDGRRHGPAARPGETGGPVIDGEFTEIDEPEETDLPPPRGSWHPKK